MLPLARRSPLPLQDCHMAHAVTLLGDKWTLLILRAALFGVRRFDDFQAELNAPRTILSGRLKTLVANGLLTKETYKVSGKRPRPEYVLTEAGAALRPVMMALTQWSDDWLCTDTPPPLAFRHASKRQRVKAAFVDEDGREVAPADMRIALRC